MTAPIAKLFKVRSLLVEQVIAYLDELERDLSELPIYFPEHLRATKRKAASFHHIRQTVNIVEDRKIFETWAEDRIRGLHDPETREGRFAYRYDRHSAPPFVNIAHLHPN